LSYALQIQFEGKQATGVVIKHDGEEKVVKAAGEIILAAGTVGTAKLLLLSGVGPKAHLQELKVHPALHSCRPAVLLYRKNCIQSIQCCISRRSKTAKIKCYKL